MATADALDLIIATLFTADVAQGSSAATSKSLQRDPIEKRLRNVGFPKS